MKICLPRLAPMAGSTIYQTTGAGIISTRVRFLGQLIYNKGGLLLRIGVKLMKMRGRNQKITPF